jgi:hypothetical protein
MATYSDIFIDQGSTYFSTINVKNSNGLPYILTGYSARGQIRKTYSSLTAINFVTSINVPSSGNVSVSLTSTQTRAMKPGRYVYDVEIYNSGGGVLRIAEGQVEISPAATKPEEE